MRRSTAPRLARAALLALVAACGVERGPELGAPCVVDTDCDPAYFCGADPADPNDDTRVCVPHADCDPARFEDQCAGRGYYTCLDGEVTWTPCDDECDDGVCVNE